MRAGFATDAGPRLLCPPQVARYRDRKAGRTYTFCGRDVNVDATARGVVKNVFDGNVVTNFDALEHLLDYAFIKLGLPGAGGDGGIDHPIVMTEAVCNPAYSRRTVSEMLFEGYAAPSVAYGIDAMFSWYHNTPDRRRSGLVVSSSHTATHVIPVVDGRGVIPLTTRLNWGGSQATELLLKLLQLKYPSFPAKLAPWQAESLVHAHCYVSDDYAEEVATYLDPVSLREKDRVVQYPFTPIPRVEKSAEELAAIAAKRKESGRRLQEQAAKARLEKLIKKEQELTYFRDLQAKAATMPKRDYKRLLESSDFDNEGQLTTTIADLEKSVKRARKQDVGPEDSGDAAGSNGSGDAVAAGPPSFDLLEIPDADLTEEQKRIKRQQRLQKSSYDARQRAKAEKEADRARLAAAEAEDALKRDRDLDSWVAEQRAARDVILARIKDRTRLRAELADRKSLASQMRMKSIAHLASDTPAPKKRRRNHNGVAGGGGGGGEPDDGFGANDDDWAVYRNIAQGGAVDAEDEEEDAAALKAVEANLAAYDPAFDAASAGGAAAARDWRNSLLYRFTHGLTEPVDLPPAPEDDPSTSSVTTAVPAQPRDAAADNAAHLRAQAIAHQLHLNIERVRVPEPIFQPAIRGLDQAGLAEIVASLLQRGGSEALLRDVFCTGGNTLFKGFDERLRTELRAVLPAGAELDVRGAGDRVGDVWRGAASWALGDGRIGASVTRAEWEEKGSEYLKEHGLGNAFG